MNKLTHVALILTACIGATASVHAQDASGAAAATPPSQRKLKGFEKEFDADHDGKLNDSEKAAMIAKYDKNGNGKIDKDQARIIVDSLKKNMDKFSPKTQKELENIEEMCK